MNYTAGSNQVNFCLPQLAYSVRSIPSSFKWQKGQTVAISTGGSTTGKMGSGKCSFIATFCTYMGSLMTKTLQSLKLT